MRDGHGAPKEDKSSIGGYLALPLEENRPPAQVLAELDMGEGAVCPARGGVARRGRSGGLSPDGFLPPFSPTSFVLLVSERH